MLPQATRNVLPDLIGNTLEVVKLTSLASVVALLELLYAARSAQSITYNPSPIVLAAPTYFVLLWPGVRLLSRLEHQMVAGVTPGRGQSLARAHESLDGETQCNGAGALREAAIKTRAFAVQQPPVQ